MSTRLMRSNLLNYDKRLASPFIALRFSLSFFDIAEFLSYPILEDNGFSSLLDRIVMIIESNSVHR